MNSQPGTKGFVTIPLIERFWQKADRSDSGCWPWRGATRRGYGIVWVNGRHEPAHKVAWELSTGRPFPEGMDACHTCDNPLCVNPAHVFAGTASDNARDAQAKGRLHNPQSVKTHCPQGHPYSGDNLYVSTKGRVCKECQRAHTRAWRQRAREALGGA